jgi:hypothetical protein
VEESVALDARRSIGHRLDSAGSVRSGGIHRGGARGIDDSTRVAGSTRERAGEHGEHERGDE